MIDEVEFMQNEIERLHMNLNKIEIRHQICSDALVNIEKILNSSKNIKSIESIIKEALSFDTKYKIFPLCPQCNSVIEHGSCNSCNN